MSFVLSDFGFTLGLFIAMLLFSTTISLTLYVIIDMEYPRYGLIRVDAADQTLIDLREPMQ